METRAKMVNVEERVKLLVTNSDGETAGIINIPKSSLEIIEWLVENCIINEDCILEELEENEEKRLG